MLPDWVIFASLGGLCSNLFNFISRYVLREKGDSSSWAWFYETFRLPLFLLISFFDFRITLNFKTIFLFLGLGITEFVSVYFYMKMHQYSKLSISTILSRTRLIWIPLIAFFLIGESLMLSGYLGILILFVGVSIAVAPHKFFFDKGAIYAQLAAFVIAINVILLKMATPYASASVIMVFYCLPSAILFPLFMKNSRKRLLESSKKNFIPKVIGTLASMGAGYFLLFALNNGEVSRVNAIYQGMIITGVLAGIFFLKEKEDFLKKILGTVVALIGIILLT